MCTWITPALCAVMLAQAPASADSHVIVQPGDVVAFTERGEIHEEQNAGVPLFFQGIAATDTSTERLQSAVVATFRPNERSTARITERRRFHIDAGTGYDTLLLTQISGQLAMRGFMNITGPGHTHAEVMLKVRDVTEGDNGPIIASHTITRHDLAGEFSPGIGLELGVEGGAPYVGGSFAVSAGIELSIDSIFVNEANTFGFTAWLRRGRTYDLELVFESEAKLGGVAGTARAEFFSPFEKSLSVANPADPALWLEALTSIADLELPNINIPRPNPLTGNGNYRFPIIETWVGSFGNVVRAVGLNFNMRPLGQSFGDTDAILAHFNLPHSAADLVTQRLGATSKTLSGQDEELDFPGVRLSGLRLAIEPDAHELVSGIQIVLAKKLGHALPADVPAPAKDGLPVLVPGSGLTFSERDGAASLCNDDVAPFFQGYCEVDTAGRRVRVENRAQVRFGRATSRIVQWNDFHVDEGNHPGAAVLTQVSGALDMQGRLLILGLGSAGLEATMVVRDITDAGDAPQNGPVVISHPVAHEEVEGDLSVGIGGELGVEGGAPYAGASFSLAAGVGFSGKHHRVRRHDDFSFVAMLQRGHTYRLELEIATTAKLGALEASTAVVNFTPLIAPKLEEPALWFDALEALAGNELPFPSIPNLPLTGSGSISLPTISTFWGDYLGQTVSMNMNLNLTPTGQQFNNARGFLDHVGLPTDLRGLVADGLGMTDEKFFQIAEELAAPGIELTHLSIAMQDDIVHKLRRAKFALESGHFSMVRGDITGDGQVNAVDVQLVINAALGFDINP